MQQFAKVEGQEIDILVYFQEYTLDTICRIALGQDETKIGKPNSLAGIKKAFGRDPREPLIFLAAAIPAFTKFFRKAFIIVALCTQFEALKILFRIKRILKERTKEKESRPADFQKERPDFIDLFLDAKSDDVDLKAEAGMSRNEVQTRHMLEDEILFSCFLFLFAGFDTTANSMSYTAWYLAKNPEIQKRLQEEIEQVCPDKDISYEQIGELKLMDAVFKEALRLHPLATTAIGRVAGNDLELGGVKLEKGDFVQIDAYTLQTDPEIWGDDAEEFNPDRWQGLNPEQKDAYVAFGGGPRQCVGMRLALMEEKLAMAYLLRDYELLPGSGFEKTLSYKGWMTVAPNSVTVTLKKRDITIE
ncbi:unnamed protein product, partial [Mesorhabditis spiculigera]